MKISELLKRLLLGPKPTGPSAFRIGASTHRRRLMKRLAGK
jgi:hypothetical protein